MLHVTTATLAVYGTCVVGCRLHGGCLLGHKPFNKRPLQWLHTSMQLILSTVLLAPSSKTNRCMRAPQAQHDQLRARTRIMCGVSYCPTTHRATALGTSKHQQTNSPSHGEPANLTAPSLLASTMRNQGGETTSQLPTGEEHCPNSAPDYEG